jgi:predicted phage gp36 major capsid-like protein
MSGTSKGGFNIGSVGGSVSVTAGGDVVAGDKTTTTTTTITNGFKQEEDKQQFVRNLEELRSALRELQAKIQGAAGVSQDDKDKIVAEVMQQVNALKTAKEEAGSLPVAQQGPPDQSKRVANYLDSTKTLLDKLNDLGAKAVEIGTAVKPYVERALPLLLSARVLFGIP